MVLRVGRSDGEGVGNRPLRNQSPVAREKDLVQRATRNERERTLNIMGVEDIAIDSNSAVRKQLRNI